MPLYKAGSVYATSLIPPTLVCKSCKAITHIPPGITKVSCRCGKVYTLLAEGHPIERLPDIV